MTTQEPSSKEVIATIRRVYAAAPGLRRYWELVVEDAHARGGLHLKFWQTFLGCAFANEAVEPTVRSIEETADILKVSMSDIQRIMHDTAVAVKARWEATPEYHEERRAAEASAKARATQQRTQGTHS